MEFPHTIKQQTCRDCLAGKDLGFDIRMAFQPIVNYAKQSVYAYEALVRGPNGEGAGWVFDKINAENRYYFDQACRVKAIETAARLGINQKLHINFLPNAVYNPRTCIRATLEAAELYGFPLEKIVFEVTESEKVVEQEKLVSIIREYSRQGFMTAIDDFGSGYAGLNWLSLLQPNEIKLDITLVRDIHQDRVKQSILKGIKQVCDDLGISVIAEGVERREELQWLLGIGITLFQGFLFARPELEALPEPIFTMESNE